MFTERVNTKTPSKLPLSLLTLYEHCSLMPRHSCHPGLQPDISVTICSHHLSLKPIFSCDGHFWILGTNDNILFKCFLAVIYTINYNNLLSMLGTGEKCFVNIIVLILNHLKQYCGHAEETILL